MIISRLIPAIAVAVTFGTALPAAAQVFTPTFMAPRASNDIGVYFSDGPGEFGMEGIWRNNFGGYDLGLRGGVADTEDLSILIGAEFRNPLVQSTPLDISLTAAGQGLIGDFSGFGFLIGLAVGHTFDLEELALTPYVHPRVGIVDGAGGGEADLELMADFGIDARFGRNIEIRFGIPLDDQASNWGVGFAWR